ncbi:MAG: peptidylprolyl isomerase [bacterium]
MRQRLIIFAFITVLVLAGGCSEKKDFRKARRIDTVEAYREYLREHPEGDYTDKAQERIRELTFRKAMARRSIRDLQSFLEEYPDSEHTEDIRLLIRSFLKGRVNNLSDRELESARLNVKTSMGSFKIKLFPKAAPKNSRNLVLLAASDFYKGLKVDMAKPGEMILLGDLIGDRLGGPGYFMPFEENDKKHQRGTVSMYHLPVDKDTGGSQFFVTLRRMPAMDGKFTVVGEVVQGLETVERISRVKTSPGKRGPKPEEPVKIEDVAVEGIDLIPDTRKGLEVENKGSPETGGGG